MLRLDDPLLPLVATEAALELGRFRRGVINKAHLRAVPLITQKLTETIQRTQSGATLAFLAPPFAAVEGDARETAEQFREENYSKMAGLLHSIDEKVSSSDIEALEGFCWSLARQAESAIAFEKRFEETLWPGEVAHVGT